MTLNGSTEFSLQAQHTTNPYQSWKRFEDNLWSDAHNLKNKLGNR